MNRQITRRTELILALWCGIVFWMVAGMMAHGAEYDCLEQGKKITAYPLWEEELTVYQDADCEEIKDTVDGTGLCVNITKAEENAFYGKYKIDDKTYTGWFLQEDFIMDLSYERDAAMARYSGKVYRRKEGSRFGKVAEYASIEILGKSGSWYQILYEYGSNYRIGWLKKATYDEIIRIYDGTEKRIMAEGTYRLSPKAKSGKSLSAGETAVGYAASGNGKKQKFTFEFVGNNCYKILSAKTGTYLSLQKEEGEYTGAVILDAAEDGEESGMTWQLTRSGAYYYLQNVETGWYLQAGSTLKAGKKSTTYGRFQITMVGGKNKNHWQVFSQYDPEWGGNYYGKTNTIAGAGCGILSVVNAVYALNGQFIDPMKLADYAVLKKYRVEHQGTEDTFFKAAAKKFGTTYGFAYAGKTTSISTLKKHLKSGGTAIAYLPGHYMAVVDYKNGKYLALDSYAREKRKTSPFGDWVTSSRFKSGGMKAKVFFLLKAS